MRSVYCFILLFGLMSFAHSARVEVTSDANPVIQGESFNLSFIASEKVDDDPDFSPLKNDFEILNQSQSSQVSIVNGSFSKKVEWILTLIAKRSGSIQVPAISFGKDKSEPISLLVNEALSYQNGDHAELILEADAEPKNPYVQAQVIYTVKLFRRIHISNGDLSEPNIANALTERLEEGPHYNVQRGDDQYAVIERKYAIFPQKSGLLAIDPVTLTAQVPGAGRSRFNSYFNQSSRTVRIQSNAVKLDVRPVPKSFTGSHWLPAEDLKLEQSWPDIRLKAGDPITHTVKIQAKGATIGLLPELIENLQAVPDIKLYPDQPVMNEAKNADGISSIREEKTALIPGKAGSYKIPALEIPWWNIKRDQMEIASLPEHVLNVEALNEPVTKPEVQKPIEQTSIEPLQTVQPERFEPNLWLTLFFAAGWLLTVLLWYFQKKSGSIKPQPLEIKPDVSLKALKQACLENDALRARQLLWLWIDKRQAGFDEVVWADEIEKLNRSIYAQGSNPWDGKALLKRIETSEKSKPEERSASLKPLYKL